MDVRLDHTILPVNNLPESVRFYDDLLGFKSDGIEEPFQVVRVSPSFVLLLAEFATSGGVHLAFSFPSARFDAVLSQIKTRGADYGDRFDQAANGHGPSPQRGATGDEDAIYITDPSRHLIEVRRCSLRQA